MNYTILKKMNKQKNQQQTQTFIPLIVCFHWHIPLNLLSVYCVLMSFFARLYGSYEDLQIGQVSEALVDFTGGVNIRIKLPAAPPDLWDILTRATYSRSLMCCQTQLGVRLTVSQLQVFPVKFSSAQLDAAIPRKQAGTYDLL